MAVRNIPRLEEIQEKNKNLDVMLAKTTTTIFSPFFSEQHSWLRIEAGKVNTDFNQSI